MFTCLDIIKLILLILIFLCSYFDPNESGSVHYGEFVWAFFNRRKLIQQWKKKTNHLTMNHIQQLFHQADTNGNGRLSYKEFAKLLVKSFGMELSKEQLEIMINHFDVDDDGEIDLYEFIDFIESEQHSFGGGTGGTGGGQTSTSALGDSSGSKAARAKQTTASRPSTSTTTSSTHHRSILSKGNTRSETPPKPSQRPSSAPRGRTKPTSLHATAPANIELSAIKQAQQRKNSFHTVTVEFDDDSTQYVQDYDQAIRKRQHLQTTPAGGFAKKTFTLSPRSHHHHNKLAGKKQHQQESESEQDHSPSPSAQSSPERKEHNASQASLPDYDDVLQRSSVIQSPESPENRSSSRTDNNTVHEEVDIMWLSKMLQAQAEVESRLGRKYYKNS